MLLTHDDIRSIDGLADPAGVLSVYVNGRRSGDRLARGLPVASALRDLEREAAASPALGRLLSARVETLRPRLVSLLRAPAAGQAVFVPLTSGEPLELAV